MAAPNPAASLPDWPAIAVSLGDPAGVGPELIADAWARREPGTVPFFAVGGAGLLHDAARRRGIGLSVSRISTPAEAEKVFAYALPVLGELDGAYRPGEPDRDGAALALASLTEATRLTTSGAAAALTTGPVSKALLAEVGFNHPGQTEFVAEACGMAAEDAVMMLAGPRLRTVPITIHLPLAQVPEALTTELIVRRARVTAAALSRDFHIARPRLAVTGLNPHAGESGRIGDEEARVIMPAIEQLRAEGLDVTGPHPADALFSPRQRETYDVAICMYHDQALIPLKALDFDAGVNVTLGLPIIRTSPDHGTAFAIAGTGQANPGALMAALRMAGACALHRLSHPA